MAKSDSCQIITMLIPSSGLIPHTNNLCRLVVHKSFNARYVSALPKKAHLYNTSTLCIVKEPKKKRKEEVIPGSTLLHAGHLIFCSVSTFSEKGKNQ